jgi:holliday junction DNA helicase RuvA
VILDNVLIQKVEMFAFIKGILINITPASVIIEAGGIGYHILIPANLYTILPALNHELKLHTSFIVRELSQTLYGFINSHDRESFECLLGVTGVGPKLALSLVGHLPLHELYRGINEKNISMLSKVPGVGKKTAERLVIEMRDKLTHLIKIDSSNLSIESFSDPCTEKINDAMSALINLGYNQMTAQKAIKKSMTDLPEGIHLAELITYALKNV